MTAPERIWLTSFVKDQHGAKLGRGTISDLDHGSNPDYPEYVRADSIEEIVKSQTDRLLEAKLAKALEALEQVAFERRSWIAGDVARATLAELKGESHEK